VRQITLDYQVTLVLVVGPSYAETVSAHLQVETQLTLQRGGQVVPCDPGDKATHAAVTDLLHLVVSEAFVDAEHVLRLRFDDGTELAVARSQEYESWNLTGVGVPQILMGPPSLDQD
jgi:hypothetical protein